MTAAQSAIPRDPVGGAVARFQRLLTGSHWRASGRTIVQTWQPAPTGRRPLTHSPLSVFAVAALTLALLGGCGEKGHRTVEPQELAALFERPTVPLTPEEVGRTFALGGRHTDVQREIMVKQLVGQVVQWEIRVYDITHRNGVYQVLSQPLSEGASGDGLNVLRVQAMVSPMHEGDHTTLRSAQTDDVVTLRGRVQSIELRALVLVGPAVLTRKAPQ